MDWNEKYSDMARRLSSSALAELFQLTERPDVISFAGGFPSEDMYLIPEVVEVAREVFHRRGATVLGYGPTPGFSEFREFIAQRQSLLGMKASPDNILVTTGSLQGLDLLGRLFLNPGEVVIVEAPTYLGALTTLAAFDVRLEAVPVDDQGLDVDQLEERLQQLRRRGRPARVLYTIPTFQNPSGLCLSHDRRIRLLELASRYDLIIFEDNAYGELRFEGEELPTLKALDEEGRVVHLGTFSKIFSPGVRLGWLHADAGVIERAVLIKQGVDQCSSSLSQLLCLEFGRRGLLERQIEITRQILRAKATATLRALAEAFPPTTQWTEPQGGFYTWVTLPPNVDTQEALPRCIREARVAYVPGNQFYTDGRGHNQLRLCYSQPSLEEIGDGVRRLGQLLAALPG